MLDEREMPPGWVKNAEGAWVRETKPRMGRRLPGFDYGARRIYEITLVLKDRRPYLGELEKVGGDEWHVRPTAYGAAALDCWREIAARWPEVELIEAQLMPDHFHGVLFVKERLPKGKSLGSIVWGFKVGCTKAWRGYSAEYGAGACARLRRCFATYPRYARLGGPNRLAPAPIGDGSPAWAEGFVDTILFGPGQLKKMIAYLRDNPRRLGVKREKPWLFKVTRELEIAKVGRFSAIGNHELLKRPVLRQVQCSRADFDKHRGVSTPIFEEKLEAALSAAKHGAVLVSPCISQGEREIARRAFEAGYSVITLRNKGFSPLYKPGGKLFESCANGNLLMLAPVAWPYQPAEKPMTRVDALVLNRLAQLIAGEGAVEINYKGVTIADVDKLAREAVAVRA